MPAARRQYEVISVSLPRELVKRANAVIPKARRSRVITNMLTAFLNSVARKQLERDYTAYYTRRSAPEEKEERDLLSQIAIRCIITPISIPFMIRPPTERSRRAHHERTGLTIFQLPDNFFPSPGRPIDFADFSRTRVVGDFDQIQVGVAEIHRHHQTSCAVSFHWASDEAHAAGVQMRDNLGNRHRSNETNVGRTRGWFFRYQGALTPQLLQIDLL